MEARDLKIKWGLQSNFLGIGWMPNLQKGVGNQTSSPDENILGLIIFKSVSIKTISFPLSRFFPLLSKYNIIS